MLSIKSGGLPLGERKQEEDKIQIVASSLNFSPKVKPGRKTVPDFLRPPDLCVGTNESFKAS
jgi:hypothetical protein